MLETLTIAVPTCRRVEWLELLLESLSRCRTPSEIDPAVTLCIIDNDAARSAEGAVEAWRPRLGRWRLLYLSESTPGVVAVRNRALAVSAGSDLLAFVDDDMEVSQDWLIELSRVRAAFGADAVFGPSEPLYAPDAPAWVRRLAPHRRRIAADGQRAGPGHTCNCLIDRRSIKRWDLRFSESLARIGAEDTLFFTQMRRRGAVLADAAEAMCWERVASERASLRWLLLRWSRTGATDHLIATRGWRAADARAAAVLKGSVRILAGGALVALCAPAALVGGIGPVLRPLRTFARGCGMVAFAAGAVFQDYGRTLAA